MTTRKETPWGIADSVTEIAPGITFYETPTHGGYHLSDERVTEMPEPLRKFQPFAGPNFYEEDADWAVVALAFPQFFPEDAIPAALATLKLSHPEIVNELTQAGGEWQRRIAEGPRQTGRGGV